MSSSSPSWGPNLRRRIPAFVAVGLAATVVDAGALLLLVDAGWAVWLADVLALVLAAGWAYFLNRLITFRVSPEIRWVRSPFSFAVVSAGAASIDLIVLLGLVGLPGGGVELLPAKVAAIGAAAVLRWVGYRWVLFRTVRDQLAHRVDRPAVNRELRLSVVVPAFNEERFIADTVAALDAEFSQAMPTKDFEVVVVDDGSSDETVARATEAGARVVAQPENGGKGAAVRAGVLASRGRSVVFTDADLAYAPNLVLRLLDELEDGWDMVVGSRRHSETDTLVRARRVREIGGSLVNRLTHLVLLGHFRDTQCGLKGFRGDIASTLFERTRIDGFAFDVELFLLAEQDGLSLREVPVAVENRAGSSVSLVGDGLALLLDLARIRLWVGQGKYLPNESQRAILSARTEEPRPTP